MNRRVIAAVLFVAVLFTMLPMIATAQEIDSDGIEASNYLDMYGAGLYSNGTTGKLKVSYKVFATGIMNTVGVFKISVRNSDGTVYQTIWGSTSNGLLATNNWYKYGEYTLSGLVSGNQYYCKVTVIAQDSSGADTRTVTTSVVTCP